jgi:hypothetical protein
MVTVNRPVHRESSVSKYSGGKARPLIIEIEPPGDRITLRLKGTRKRWSVPVATVLAVAVQAEAQAKRDAKKAARKSRNRNA